MAIRRRRATATDPAPALPWSVLHLFCTGDLLRHGEGERLYGPSYAWLDCYEPAYHPDHYGELWQRHRAEIEAHARRLGLARPWLADHIHASTPTDADA